MSAQQGRLRQAWVLRVNRKFGPVEEFRSARRFARSFRPDSRSELAPSQITRWESGSSGVDHRVFARYEALLGLPDDLLAVPLDAAGRFHNTANCGAEPVDDSVLHRLLDQARFHGAMSGGDWRVLTYAVSARPGLVLHPPRLWRVIADTLLGELVVAEHSAWLVRQEAMSKLLEHPASARHAVRACVDMANDSGNPACIEPISLLDVTTLPEANRYVVEVVRDPHDLQSLHGGLLAVAAKVRRRHYASADLADLTRVVEGRRTAHRGHPTVSALVDELGRVLRREPVRFAADHVLIGERLALAAQSRLPNADERPDRVLARLITESLFSGNPDQRLYSTALITATPCRQALATALEDWIVASGIHDEVLVECGLRLLAGLRVSSHRRLVRALLLDPSISARGRHAAAWASSHSEGRVDERTWRAIVRKQKALCRVRPSGLDEEILRGLVYSVGTDAHTGLLRELALDREIPPRVRRLAQWWASRSGPLKDVG